MNKDAEALFYAALRATEPEDSILHTLYFGDTPAEVQQYFETLAKAAVRNSRVFLSQRRLALNKLAETALIKPAETDS